MNKFWTFIFSLVLSSCSETNNQTLPYAIERPTEVHLLNSELDELSGISFIDDNRLACIQDEKGVVFIYNLNKKEIESTIEFAEQGDYEDLVVIDKTLYVLKSDGTIYKLENFTDSAGLNVTEHPTTLSKSNDAEGISYDVESKSLIISCKGKSEHHKKNSRGIYSLDTETFQLNVKPYLTIMLDELKKSASANPVYLSGDLKVFNEKNISKVFVPSAIAIHPFTKHIYVASAVNNLLAVMDKQGKVLHVVSLKADYFGQPEGLAFDKQGNLYISNEAKSQQANIVRFDYDNSRK